MEKHAGKRAVIYARFSSSAQREESIEGQVRDNTAYIEREGMTLCGVYADKAISGQTDKRPQFQRMMRDAERGIFDVVVCWKHDRFARDRFDAAIYKKHLKENGVSVLYSQEVVIETPEGIILDGLMDSFSEYYSVNLGQTTRRGMYDAALKHKVITSVAYGYRIGNDGRYEIKPGEAAVVHRIFRDYAAGVSPTVIAEALDNAGYRIHGKPVRAGTLTNMVRNVRYKGVYRYADICDEDGVPPIVSPELWQRANDVVDARRYAPRAKADKYLLSGKVFCARCGDAMTGESATGRAGKMYRYYSCMTMKKKHACTNERVCAEWLDDLVVDALTEIVFSDELCEVIADRVSDYQERIADNSEQLAAEKRVRDLNKEIENLTVAIAAGGDVTILTKAINDRKELRDGAENELRDILSRSGVTFSRETILAWLHRFRETDFGETRWRSFLVRSFLSRVYVDGGGGKVILQLNYTGDCNGIELDVLKSAETSGEVVACFDLHSAGVTM